MYLTAHSVRGRDGVEGINAFRHEHGADFDWPEDARRLPEENPGQEVARTLEVRPGGNRVRAYLDVLAPDSIDRARVRDALDVFRANLEDQLNPAVFRMHGVTCLFGAEFALRPERAATFDALRARLAALEPEIGRGADASLA